MLSVYLCDDNEMILNKYKEQLLQIAKDYNLILHILTSTSGEQLLFHLDGNPNKANIIYLDILMGGENGIVIAKQLRALGCKAEIIFLTSNPEYVFDSFDVSPIHYILKDHISDERFREIFFKAVVKAEKNSSAVFSCSSENNTVTKQIRITDITHFMVQNRSVSVYYNKASFTFYARMEDIEQKLGNRDFIRIHRSYLVHLTHIDHITKNSVVLVTGESLPMGITYAKTTKLSFQRYFNLFQ